MYIKQLDPPPPPPLFFADNSQVAEQNHSQFNERMLFHGE